MTKGSENVISIPFGKDMDFQKGLSQYLLEAFEKYKNVIAQIDSTTDEKQTYGEIFNKSIRLAQALLKKGITSEDVVAYCCYNNMDYAVTITAAIFIGARFNAIDISTSKSEILHCLNLSKPKLMFCDPEIEDVMHAASVEEKLNFDIVVYGSASAKNITFNDFLVKYKSDDKFEIDTSRTGMDTVCISYTSGTSGKPKAAQLKHFAMYYSGLVSNRSWPDAKVIMIFTLPYWISNIAFCISTIISGQTRIIYKTFNKETLGKVLEKYKVNLTFLTQLMMNELTQNPQYCKIDTSNLKYILYGGSTIGAGQILKLKELFPSSTMLNGYGMTEMCGFVFSPTKKEYDFSQIDKVHFSVGKPIPGYTYKIVDPATEEILGPNQKGELRLKYVGVWNGYIDNPKATEEACDSEGFYKTGDIVYYDDEHFFYIVDRLKEIFKYKGYHISPTTIEDKLISHPDVQDAVAIGIPDDRDGELPMGVVVLKPNAKVTKEELIDYANDRLPDMYHLRGGIKFVTKIIKTATGKNRRNFLRDQILKGQSI